MAQEIINYGAAANDGTGDPLRTAFIKTDNNFDQIWATGPVGSNVTIVNNTVGVTNTNGNLVLMPNGIGAIQTNSRVVPSLDNTYDLGSADRRYRSLHVGTGGLSVAGNLSAGALDLSGDVVIDGNLTVNGDATYINVANLIVEDKTIVLANGSPNAATSNGGGIVLDGSNATITYSSSANRWEFNLGTFADGLTATRSLAVQTNGFAWFMGGDVLTTPNGGTWYSDTVGNDEYISSAYDGFISISSLYNSGNIASEIDLEHGQLRLNVSDTIGNAYVWELGQSQLDGSVIPDTVFPGNIVSPGLTTTKSLAIRNNGFSWFVAGNILSTPNGGSWYADTIGNDEYISSAFDGYISISSLYSTGNIGSELDLLHGTASINIHDFDNNAYSWQFGESGPGGVIPDLFTPGNIIPKVNNIYSLGNATNQWSDLYVSNATIYMNNVPVALTAGNVLTVAGQPLLSNDSNTSITTSGNITAEEFFGNLAASNVVGLSTVATTGSYNDLTNKPVIPTATSNLTNDSGFITDSVAGNLAATGNVTGGNLISNSSLYANVDLIVGDRSNPSASKGRFVSNSGFMYLQIGNGTAGSTGNIVFSPYQSSTARVTVDTASGNITAVGNVSAGNIYTSGNITGNTAGYAIGYRDIPQVSFTGNATVVTADAGKHFYSTESTDYMLTIASNASQGFQVGAAITVVNQGTGTITIAQGSGVTLYMAGNATPGNRTLSTFGMATIMKVATDTWFVNGTGVS